MSKQELAVKRLDEISQGLKMIKENANRFTADAKIAMLNAEVWDLVELLKELTNPCYAEGGCDTPTPLPDSAADSADDATEEEAAAA